MSEQELGTADDVVSGAEQDLGSEHVETDSTLEAPVAEKMVPQSHVNKLIGLKIQQAEAKADARLRAREAELMASQKSGTPQDSADPMSALIAEIKSQIHTSVSEQVSSLKIQQEDAQIARDYQRKLEAALVDDPEMVDVVEDLGLKPETSGVDAQLIREVTKLDNTAAVLKEMAQHPEKFSTVRGFLREGNTKMAAKALANLSSSIAKNEAARTSEKAPKPLSQLKPSNLGIGGGKAKTQEEMKDYFANR